MTKEDLLTLYDKYCNSVYRIALSYTCTVHDAEDITQVVFLKLMEKQPTLEVDNEKAFILKMTANACKDFLKSNWRKKQVHYDSLEEPVYENMLPEESEIFQAVMQLPVKYRIVIHLHYYEDYSLREIAEILNLSTSAISMRLHRGRELLKHLISKEVSL